VSLMWKRCKCLVLNFFVIEFLWISSDEHDSRFKEDDNLWFAKAKNYQALRHWMAEQSKASDIGYEFETGQVKSCL
ncbi:hypothetical protein J6590_098981, partial [Homalodisca vitripennis]